MDLLLGGGVVVFLLLFLCLLLLLDLPRWGPTLVNPDHPTFRVVISPIWPRGGDAHRRQWAKECRHFLEKALGRLFFLQLLLLLLSLGFILPHAVRHDMFVLVLEEFGAKGVGCAGLEGGGGSGEGGVVCGLEVCVVVSCALLISWKAGILTVLAVVVKDFGVQQEGLGNLLWGWGRRRVCVVHFLGNLLFICVAPAPPRELFNSRSQRIVGQHSVVAEGVIDLEGMCIQLLSHGGEGLCCCR